MVKKQSTTDQPATQVDEQTAEVGRPEHAPTVEQRKLVEVLSQYGVKHKSIAVQVGVSLMTLRKHYITELMMGDAKVQGLIGQTSLRVALGSPAEYYPDDHPRKELRGKLAKAEREPDTSMLQFFMKTRMGLVPHIGLDLDPFGKTEDLEFNTAGMTNTERVTRLAELFDNVVTRMKSKIPPPTKPAPPAETKH